MKQFEKATVPWRWLSTNHERKIDMKNPNIKVINLDLSDAAGQAELTKMLEEIFVGKKKADTAAEELTAAFQVFVEENLSIADSYRLDRNAVMLSSMRVFMDAVLENDWNKYDFESHDIKREG